MRGKLNNKGPFLSSRLLDITIKLLEIDPDDAGALNNKGDALANLGRYDEADYGSRLLILKMKEIKKEN